MPRLVARCRWIALAWDPNRLEWDPDKAPWELYNIEQDFSQATDLAAKFPEKLRQLQDLWWVEAAKYSVLRSTKIA